MSKHIIEFDLSDESDKHDLHITMQANAMHSVISDIFNLIRNKTKYTAEKSITWEELKDTVNKIIDEHDVRLIF